MAFDPWNKEQSGDYTDRLPEEQPFVSGARLITLNNVKPERVRWLWPDHLPCGKVVMLDGDPGVGKSTLAMDWAARVSTGAAWPDGTPGMLGDVLMLSAEDDLSDTLRPRLDAAGGDPARVHALTGIDTADEDGRPYLRTITLADMIDIEQVVTEHVVRLVIVDVLMAYLPTRVDSHKDQDIRVVLARLAALAQRTGCCVVLLRHLNKSSGKNPLYRGGGSIGIVGAARAGFLAAMHPEDEERRVLACIKLNNGEKPPTFGYRLVPTENEATRIEWGSPDELSATALLEDDDDRTRVEEARAWLEEYLIGQGGVASRQDIMKVARAQGFAERTLTRARQKPPRITYSSSGFPRVTYWSLTTDGTQSGQSGQSGQVFSVREDMAPTPEKGGLTDLTGLTVHSPESAEESDNSDETSQKPWRSPSVCCEGGPLKHQCQLCRQSPTYWNKSGSDLV